MKKCLNLNAHNVVSSRKYLMYGQNSKKQQNINLLANVKQ